MALENSHVLTYSMSHFTRSSNLYSSDLQVEELILPPLLRLAPHYRSLNPFVQKEEVLGRNKFLNSFEMLLPKTPTSTCQVKDIALSYSADEIDYTQFIYKSFIHLKCHKYIQLPCFLPSSEMTESYNYTAVSFDSSVWDGLKFSISLYVMPEKQQNKHGVAALIRK